MMRGFQYTKRNWIRRGLISILTLAALALLFAAAPPAFASEPADEEGKESPVWWADMLVVEYTDVSIGADSADLFSNVGGSAGFQVKSLWSYTPDRDLRLTFQEGIPSTEDLTLQVGDLRLAFPAGSSGNSAFRWKDVDVDWEDGQTLAVRIVRTSAVEATRPNSPATGAPTISGTAQVGETLTADTAAIDDEDGLDNAVFGYQWLADDADIQGETASTYTLVTDDVGKAIKVRVSFDDDAGNEETLNSAATAAVAAKPNSLATGAPTISGTAQVGETLTANTTGIADKDGLTDAVFGYQWLADDADIQGETVSTYTLVTDDVGKAIKVRVSFTDDATHEETLTSAATAAVAARPNSLATGAPTIGGTVQVGETLTANTTGIGDKDGLTNAVFGYQWLADDADIQGETASTYTLVTDDVGKAIKVRVSFTDDATNEETLTSAATAAVASEPGEPKAAQTEGGICGRTEQVQDDILYRLHDISDCALVTDTNLASISWLYMQYEDIAELQSGDFQGLSNLRYLNLGNNELSELPADIFSGLSNLEQLELDYNELSELPADIFSGLSNLEKLDLDFNELSELPADIFSGLSNLEELELSQNDLEELPISIFDDLDNLKKLHLLSNPGTHFGTPGRRQGGWRTIAASDTRICTGTRRRLRPRYPRVQ